VLVVALDQSYDYLVPDDLELEPGCFVLVPFGPRSRIGVVWDAPAGELNKEVEDGSELSRRYPAYDAAKFTPEQALATPPTTLTLFDAGGHWCVGAGT